MAHNANLAFVFPGQGSQQVGMLAQFAEQWPETVATFNEASEVLGYDLWQLVQQGPQESLNLTENSQPALLTASVAVWRVWSKLTDVKPALMAGHSLGEWSALVCSDAVEFTDAVKLVQLRGRFMQEAVPVGVGTMAAIIGLDDKVIIESCEKAAEDEVVSAVNFNSPGQVVIAGHKGAVERASELCKAAGAKRALPLPVSAPFHTALMQPAAEKLADFIKQTSFKAPSIPVIHNVNAKVESSPDAIKALMIEQIYAPVRWVECVQAMRSAGADTFIEAGPGKVLGGLIKRIDKETTSYATETPAAIEQAVASV